MRFTRRTYGAAIRRAWKREAQAWNDRRMALRGPHVWHAAIRTRKALEQRRIREQGKEQER